MEKMVLSEYYKGLANSEKKNFREQVMGRTGLSLPAFYYKSRNRKWTKAEQFIIAFILEKSEGEIVFN